MTECAVHKLIADVAVVAEEQVLMVRYTEDRHHSAAAGWFLPDDLLRPFESPEDAARRILAAQVGVDPDLGGSGLFLSHVESFRGALDVWNLVFHFVTQFEKLPDITMAEAIDCFEWFYLDQLPLRGEVAHHGRALDTIREILKRAS